jgi:Tfp pilus assembly protein PilF
MSRIDQLKAFLADTPDDSFLQHALALEYIKLGDDAAARLLFEAVLLREPGYVGSYYHLGKLLERQGTLQSAMDIYRKGMEIARSVNDRHAYSELQGALEEIED